MMAGAVAFAVLALLALLIFGLAWVGSWDRGPNPREPFTPDQRKRVEALKDSEGEALAPCCCAYHGRRWCEVHGSGYREVHR